MKYLSVITNFGCHYNCPYCIVKNNNIHIPKTTIEGLDNLHNEIINNDIDIVSISGGGDPLYNVTLKTINWYTRLFEITKNIKLELHTTYPFSTFNNNMPANFYRKFYRNVYHIININNIKEIKRAGHEIVRVVFVVDSSFTESKILQIVNEVKNNKVITELSFRQMVDSEYQTTNYCQEFLEKGHEKDWYYIKQNDYNIYYAENKISYSYEKFKDMEDKQ